MEILSGPNECVVLVDNPTHQNLISNTSEVDPRECVLDTYETQPTSLSYCFIFQHLSAGKTHSSFKSGTPHCVAKGCGRPQIAF